MDATPSDERALAVTEAREAGLEARIAALQEALLAAETRSASLADEVGESDRQRAELELQLGATRDALRTAEEWIETIHASKSWKLTTPLRRAAAFLRARG